MDDAGHDDLVRLLTESAAETAAVPPSLRMLGAELSGRLLRLPCAAAQAAVGAAAAQVLRAVLPRADATADDDAVTAALTAYEHLLRVVRRWERVLPRVAAHVAAPGRLRPHVSTAGEAAGRAASLASAAPPAAGTVFSDAARSWYLEAVLAGTGRDRLVASIVRLAQGARRRWEEAGGAAAAADESFAGGSSGAGSSGEGVVADVLRAYDAGASAVFSETTACDADATVARAVALVSSGWLDAGATGVLEVLWRRYEEEAVAHYGRVATGLLASSLRLPAAAEASAALRAAGRHLVGLRTRLALERQLLATPAAWDGGGGSGDPSATRYVSRLAYAACAVAADALLFVNSDQFLAHYHRRPTARAAVPRNPVLASLGVETMFLAAAAPAAADADADADAAAAAAAAAEEEEEGDEGAALPTLVLLYHSIDVLLREGVLGSVHGGGSGGGSGASPLLNHFFCTLALSTRLADVEPYWDEACAARNNHRGRDSDALFSVARRVARLAFGTLAASLVAKAAAGGGGSGGSPQRQTLQVLFQTHARAAECVRGLVACDGVRALPKSTGAVVCKRFADGLRIELKAFVRGAAARLFAPDAAAAGEGGKATNGGAGAGGGGGGGGGGGCVTAMLRLIDYHAKAAALAVAGDDDEAKLAALLGCDAGRALRLCVGSLPFMASVLLPGEGAVEREFCARYAADMGRRLLQRQTPPAVEQLLLGAACEGDGGGGKSGPETAAAAAAGAGVAASAQEVEADKALPSSLRRTVGIMYKVAAQGSVQKRLRPLKVVVPDMRSGVELGAVFKRLLAEVEENGGGGEGEGCVGVALPPVSLTAVCAYAWPQLTSTFADLSERKLAEEDEDEDDDEDEDEVGSKDIAASQDVFTLANFPEPHRAGFAKAAALLEGLTRPKCAEGEPGEDDGGGAAGSSSALLRPDEVATALRYRDLLPPSYLQKLSSGIGMRVVWPLQMGRITLADAAVSGRGGGGAPLLLHASACQAAVLLCWKEEGDGGAGDDGGDGGEERLTALELQQRTGGLARSVLDDTLQFLTTCSPFPVLEVRNGGGDGGGGGDRYAVSRHVAAALPSEAGYTLRAAGSSGGGGGARAAGVVSPRKQRTGKAAVESAVLLCVLKKLRAAQAEAEAEGEGEGEGEGESSKGVVAASVLAEACAGISAISEAKAGDVAAKALKHLESRGFVEVIRTEDDGPVSYKHVK